MYKHVHILSTSIKKTSKTQKLYLILNC